MLCRARSIDWHPCTAPRCTLQGSEWVVVVEYTLMVTPQVSEDVLVKAEVAVYLFFRVQAPTIPWWTGERAGRGGGVGWVGG